MNSKGMCTVAKVEYYKVNIKSISIFKEVKSTSISLLLKRENSNGMCSEGKNKNIFS